MTWEQEILSLFGYTPSSGGPWSKHVLEALNAYFGTNIIDAEKTYEEQQFDCINNGITAVSTLKTAIVDKSLVLSPNATYPGGPTGTLTEPATSNVLTGVIYGVSGTGSTGTFNPWVFGNITVVSNLANPDPAGSYSYHGIVNGYISFRYVSALTWQIYYVGNVVHLAPLVGGVPDATNYYVIGSQPTGSLISSLSTAHGNLTGVVLTRNYLLSS
jgi:hypothetical protein